MQIIQKRRKEIPYLWDELNVINKTFGTGKMDAKGFSITKLNGMALFIDKNAKNLVELSKFFLWQ